MAWGQRCLGRSIRKSRSRGLGSSCRSRRRG
ncbi:hypothetical protein FHS27_003308 [Rhodopirellula rubra]|uniref:Uncharacterized protein n=1 Tax=Aporhodopirellula rubra TaxID=980271 RepID=A0A7W5DZN8_9BACT|nr:hypothetical protein [Aporhodopirellula rubra]